MQSEGSLGISPHSDAGFLTLLAQGSTPGLEVWHDGAWRLVEPISGAFTVNVGDMCQVQASCPCWVIHGACDRRQEWHHGIRLLHHLYLACAYSAGRGPSACASLLSHDPLLHEGS